MIDTRLRSLFCFTVLEGWVKTKQKGSLRYGNRSASAPEK
jgi:hypothetical protein